jgi:predicted ferric reductase
LTTTTWIEPKNIKRPATAKLWGLRALDVYGLVGGLALLIAGMWWRHGGLNEFDTWSGSLTAIGELTALYGTYLVLIQLVLMARTPYLDQVFGQDHLILAHRWVGFGAIWLILAHVFFTTLGFAVGDGSSLLTEFINLLTNYAFVLWSGLAILLFIVVGITSVRIARGYLSYEAWYFVHLTVYLAIALAFLHQLVVGIDFANDPAARGFWIGLYIFAFGLIFTFRFGQPFLLSFRHRLTVANVVSEGPGVVSLYLAGRNLHTLAISSGQWFRLRFLTSEGWYRAHPFSLSAAPNGQYLRFTIKDLGDYTHHLQTVGLGTTVFVEGPYGNLTNAARVKSKALLIAGGVGITPLRALLEDLPVARGNLTLIYRATTAADLIFKNEIDTLARLRGVKVHYLVGRRGSAQMPYDPLEARALKNLVPDIASYDVYLCGPTGLAQQVLASLYKLRLSAAQIHYERFSF